MLYSIKYFEYIAKNSSRFLEIEKSESKIDSTLYQTGMFDDSICTAVRFIGSSDNPYYYKYVIEHEEKINIHGRLNKTLINYYISIDTIDLYRSKTEDFFILKGKTDLVKAATDKLSSENFFSLISYKLDLKSLCNDISREYIKGCWFGNLKIKDVSSSAIFGISAGESDIFTELKSKGDMSTLYINAEFTGYPLDLILCKNGTILINNRWNENNSLTEISAIIDLIRKYFII